MDNIQELAAMTALNNMFRSEHFNICTLDAVAKLLNVNPRGRTYDILHVLHCVDYGKMPKELYDVLPKLIRECLSLNPIYEFEHLRKQTIIVGQSPVTRFLKFVNG